MTKIRVTLKRSLIGAKRVHMTNMVGLGLRHPNQVRILENTPAVRGMIKKVIHMVEVEEIHDQDCEAAAE
jgi:large subunit ribosomal protein L30